MTTKQCLNMQFAVVNIFYRSESIAKKAGTLYSDTCAYIICTRRPASADRTARRQFQAGLRAT